MTTIIQTPVDEILSTTRTVRRRLDFDRPVEEQVLRQCFELAIQAPSGGNRQAWSFVVVTDPAQRAALGAIYQRAFQVYRDGPTDVRKARAGAPERSAAQERIFGSVEYLAQNIHRTPVLLIPCMAGRCEDKRNAREQAGFWGSILPAVWSFMLAARARGLGTAWTTMHLMYEGEAAELLGIPFDRVTQVGLIPVAYTHGTEFKSAAREQLDTFLHWNRW